MEKTLRSFPTGTSCSHWHILPWEKDSSYYWTCNFYKQKTLSIHFPLLSFLLYNLFVCLALCLATLNTIFLNLVKREHKRAYLTKSHDKIGDSHELKPQNWNGNCGFLYICELCLHFCNIIFKSLQSILLKRKTCAQLCKSQKTLY